MRSNTYLKLSSVLARVAVFRVSFSAAVSATWSNGAPVPDDMRCEIRTEAQSAYEALAKLHAEVMKCP